MRNKNYRRILAAFLVVTLFISGIYLYVSANEDESNFNKFTLAHGQIGRIESKINKAMVPATQMGTIRDGIVEELGKHKKKDRTNVREMIVSRLTGSITGIVNNLLDQLTATMSGIDLVKALDKVNISLDQYITSNIEVEIFEKPGVGYNDTYDRMLDYYGKLNDKHRREANEAIFGIFGLNTADDLSDRLVADKWSVPDKSAVTVSKCEGPCHGWYEDADEHVHTCGGCGDDYYECNKKDKEEHQIKYCNRAIYYTDTGSFFMKSIYLGLCGEKYRNCDDPLTRKVHNYTTDLGWGQNSWGFWGWYKEGIKASKPTVCAYGQSEPHSVAINGPNGVGLDESDYDETPNCPSCIDGSGFCPDASTQHSRTPATPESNPAPQSNPDPPSEPETEDDSEDNGDGKNRYYCPWCGEHYDPNNNYSGACSVLGFHDGFAD